MSTGAAQPVAATSVRNEPQAVPSQPFGSAYNSNEDPFASFIPWLSPDMASGGDVSLFEGFDIPFWMGQDEISTAWMYGSS